MVTLTPQFITDSKGKKLSIILPIEEFDAMMEHLDELEDIMLYEQAKKEDDGERILFSDYLKSRQQVHA